MEGLINSKLASELRAIHHVVTRGLRIALENSLSESQGGPSREWHPEGFLSYVETLVTVLDAHHLTEDELAFPYFRDKLPEAPFDLLVDQHRQLVPLLTEIKVGLAKLAELTSDSDAKRAYQQIHSSLERLDELWHPHIQIEEEHFTAKKVNSLLSPEEENRLCGLLTAHGRDHAKPDFLVVPFLLYNLPPEERIHLSAAMPSQVTQQLAPIVWKSHWEPMRPFLYSH